MDQLSAPSSVLSYRLTRALPHLVLAATHVWTVLCPNTSCPLMRTPRYCLYHYIHDLNYFMHGAVQIQYTYSSYQLIR
ncbi:uncharacterized protein F5147DRAFT_272867 [Suillus discolor]|uniref:Uncharacterized protein n=1 Tax=Suillus discolor TaxID=1912936 RepID=A0A9P7F4B9_9AGAM|nr:uncharacterized protein F5147DRAFT_272867 [Suillus discolor]KAG2104104.1 hypothetical protein F5147DRAFT_272867 [Suillus discolor]